MMRNREKRRWGGRRALLIEIAVPLLVLLALELGLRSYAAGRSDFPLPRYFTSSIDTGKFLALRERAATEGRLDVLLLGMSPMMRVYGAELHRVLAQRGAGSAVFNFAGPYHGIEFDRRLLRDIVLPLEVPRVIVYGVTPLVLLNERGAEDVDRFVRDLPVFHIEDGSLAERLRGTLLLHVRLLAYREYLRDRLTPGRAVIDDPWTEKARNTNRFGDIELMKIARPVRNLAGYELRWRKRFADFDRLMRTSPVFPNLRSLARLCRERGIELVILNNAVHPLFLTLLPDGQRDYQRFVDRIRRLAAAADVRFFDPAGGRPGRPELFNDTLHHNAAGGVWLTGELADYLLAQGLVGGEEQRQPSGE